MRLSAFLEPACLLAMMWLATGCRCSRRHPHVGAASSTAVEAGPAPAATLRKVEAGADGGASPPAVRNTRPCTRHGQVVWARRYGRPTQEEEDSDSIARAWGGVAVVGHGVLAHLSLDGMMVRRKAVDTSVSTVGATLASISTGGDLVHQADKPERVERLASDLTPRWKRSPLCDNEHGTVSLEGVAAGPSGRVAVGGEFSGRAGELDKGCVQFPGTQPEHGSGAFVFGLDPAGQLSWVRRFRGVPTGVGIEGMAFDRKGSLYVAGHFAHRVRAGSRQLGGGSSLRRFVAKLTSQGDVSWLRAVPGREAIDSIAADDGQVTLAGIQYFAVHQRPWALRRADSAAWIGRLGPEGNLRWARAWIPPRAAMAVPHAHAVVPAGKGDVLVAGNVSDERLRLPGGGHIECPYDPKTDSFEDYSDQDCGFIVRLDAHGHVVWSSTLRTTYASPIEGMVSTPEGIFVVGEFRDLIDWGDGMILRASRPEKWEAFVARLCP